MPWNETASLLLILASHSARSSRSSWVLLLFDLNMNSFGGIGKAISSIEDDETKMDSILSIEEGVQKTNCASSQPSSVLMYSSS